MKEKLGHWVKWFFLLWSRVRLDYMSGTHVISPIFPPGFKMPSRTYPPREAPRDSSPPPKVSFIIDRSYLWILESYYNLVFMNVYYLLFIERITWWWSGARSRSSCPDPDCPLWINPIAAHQSLTYGKLYHTKAGLCCCWWCSRARNVSPSHRKKRTQR